MDFNQYNEEQVEREAEQEENERETFTRWLVHKPDGKTYITEYQSDASLIVQMEKMAKRLAATTTAPTKTVVGDDGSKQIVPTRIGEDLIALCERFDPALPKRHRHHVFNPWIGIMLVAFCHWCGPTGFAKVIRGRGIVPGDRDALHRVVRFVRKVCGTRVFNAKLQTERDLARQNFDSACAYIVSLFARCSRLLILRVDLYYWGEGKKWARTSEAASAFDKFLDNLRRSRIILDVLGCLMRREEGPERGIHFHVLVALDGHKRRDAYGLTEEIGKDWVNRYSNGRGSFFNCYTRRHDYRFNGLGLVHMSDQRKLIGVRVALRYITKPDYQVKDRVRVRDRRAGKNGVGTTAGGKKARGKKNFRRGLMRRDEVKRGAPRRHEMSTVWRLLGPANTARRSK